MCLKDLPLVSIFVISYNQENFIRNTIDSVLSQTYSNIQIVIGDDGSKDNTFEIIENLRQEYPDKIECFTNKINLGITKNCNKVLERCKGKYIAFLGGDDLMLPNKIEQQVKYMEAHSNCTICYHNLEWFDSSTNETIKYKNSERKVSGDVKTSILEGCFNGGSSTMIRTSKVPEGGFNESIPIASDWLFWVEALMKGGTIDYINEVLARYRRHGENVTDKESPFFRQQVQDHLNSCNVMLVKYPNYSYWITKRYKQLVRRLRFKFENSYESYLKQSCYLFDTKAIIAYGIYIITLKKVRL